MHPPPHRCLASRTAPRCLQRDGCGVRGVGAGGGVQGWQAEGSQTGNHASHSSALAVHMAIGLLILHASRKWTTEVHSHVLLY